MKVSPFIRWAGGKRNILPQIDENLPSFIKSGESFDYKEPFIGGGAVLFHLLSKYKNIKDIEISDSNKDLILVYKSIKEDF